jgi:hypothetical protein
MLAAVALLQTRASGAGAPTFDWVFRTPGEVAYCALESRPASDSAFRCITPSDGFWIRIAPITSGARVTKGYAKKFRGFHRTSVPRLEFGRPWISGDAALISCLSRRSGLTCKQYDGLSFWLGRRAGYRIYIDKPGFAPEVRPFFRTPQGVWCGLDRAVLEPAAAGLVCWRPADGLELGLRHAERATYRRRAMAEDFRPRGFPLLDHGRTFIWRCTKIERLFATNCSVSAGDPVFTCTSQRARLTCRNRAGHGFWVNAHNFYGF